MVVESFVGLLVSNKLLVVCHFEIGMPVVQTPQLAAVV
jgi:hypothetical protein